MTVTLTPQQRLRQDIGLVLDQEPMISGRQAHRRINPGIGYETFMDHFNAVVEARGLQKRKPGRPRKVPLPAPVVSPTTPRRMESDRGRFEGAEQEDGRFRVELRYSGTVSRAVYRFFLGAMPSLLFPEAEE